MADGGELMNRLMSENADLKKQVRLLKENQMLKRLLSESCQETCGRGGRDLLFPKTPSYPEACSPGSGEIQSFAGAEKDGRIVGEIAFQLDRRILAYVFPGVTRLYGFTVSNIPEKIKQTSIKSLDGSVDEKKLRELTHRYLTLTARLEKLGYSREVHPVFSEFLINTYGILKQRPDLRANPLHSSPAALRKLVIDIVPPKFLGDSLLLLNCLCELSKEDSKPLFAW
uniref:Spermatogenesis and centriole associated 1 like n=1 Tax=Jaculus jaculus TaxID=51337 RepID=A0A8C5NV83_JACJA